MAAISIEGQWEEMQRHGQDIAERVGSLAQGLGFILQGRLPQSPIGVKVPLPWVWSSSRAQEEQQQVSAGRVGYEINKAGGVHSFYDLGSRLGQAGSDFGACVGGLVDNVVKQFSKPIVAISDSRSGLTTAGLTTFSAASRQSSDPPGSSVELSQGSLEWCESGQHQAAAIGGQQEDVASSSSCSSEAHDVPGDDFLISKTGGHLHKQNSISITTTYDSRTQDIESSVVARGDLWRAEASHLGASSNNGSPLFLIQVGPILLVRDTTVLLPIHLSKRHLLWYGYDRKSGLHSLSPAVWSKNRKWLMMSMLCLNPLTCSFMDLQFPNGQMTYVAGEGVSSSGFLPVRGGLFQFQGRYPGDAKISFSCKNAWGTKLCPSFHYPEKSLSVGITQALAWQRSGVLLRPTVQLSVTPTFSGRNAGWRAEVTHSPSEKLSVTCGCSSSLEPTVFATVAVGRSKRNGEHTGSSGLVLQVETPTDNVRRAAVSIQLNSSVEF